MTHYFSNEEPYRHPYAIKGVIFDNDNTLYAEPDNAQEYHYSAAIEAVQIQCPDLTEETIKSLLLKSKLDKEKYGGSLDIFVAEYGADMDDLRDDHYNILIKKTKNSGFFDPEKTPRAGLSKLRIAGINLGIATHGNGKWTNFSLEESGVCHLFNNVSCHVYKDDIENQLGKDVSPVMYDAVLDSMHVPLAENLSQRGVHHAVVEDSMVNLKFAKERGMMTILIDTGQYTKDEIANYVDVVVKDRHDMINVIIESNAIHEIDSRLQLAEVHETPSN